MTDNLLRQIDNVFKVQNNRIDKLERKVKTILLNGIVMWIIILVLIWKV